MAAVFPLSVSANKRYLVDAQGTPFPVFGDSAWYPHLNLGTVDQLTYLQDRVAKGFTAILGPAIEHTSTVSKPPKDFNGNLPFTQQLGGSTYTGSPNGCALANGSNGQYAADDYTTISTQAPDFTFPNSTYWTAVDTFLTLCASLGLAVFLFPCYVGFNGLDQGWMRELAANDLVIGAGGQSGQGFANAAKSQAWNYGAWLANRYKTFSNIVWVHGGDYGSGGSSGTFTTAQKTAVDNLMQGMKSVAGQLSTLHTAHWSRAALASDVVLTSPFDVEAVYADSTPHTETRSGYLHAPAAPAFMIEGEYDQGGSGTNPWRKYLWWVYTSGGTGFYGDGTPGPAGPIWLFNTVSGGWQSLLSTAGVLDMQRMFAFIRARPWHRLVPDGQNGMRTVVTSNGGSGTSLITAAADYLGTCAVIYVPPASSGAFNVNMACINSKIFSARCRWFDPTNGAFTAIGSVATTGTHSFTPPGLNAGGSFTDWVLLIEAEPVLLPHGPFGGGSR